MTLLAHLDAGLINTWGFAYTGGIIGLFTMALLYVKGRVADGSTRSSATRSKLAVLGPGVIAAGGVCGVSLGLGIAGLLERTLVDEVDIASVVERLCAPGAEGADLHDDIVHAIDDLSAEDAGAAHLELHAGLRTGDAVDRLVLALTTADGDRVDSCESARRVEGDVEA